MKRRKNVVMFRDYETKRYGPREPLAPGHNAIILVLPIIRIERAPSWPATNAALVQAMAGWPGPKSFA